MAVGFAVTNGDFVVHNPKGLAQALKASLEFGSVVGPDVSWLPPRGHDSLIQKIGSSPAVQRWGRGGFYPLRERVDRYQQVTISVLISGERSCSINTPSSKRGLSFVYPSQHFGRGLRRAVLLANGTVADTVYNVRVHLGPPKIELEGGEQLIPAAVAETIMGVHHQPVPGDQWRYVYPSLFFGPRGFELNL